VLNGSLQSRSKGGEESFPTCIVSFDLVTDDSKINRLTISWWLLQMLSASIGCSTQFCMWAIVLHGLLVEEDVLDLNPFHL